MTQTVGNTMINDIHVSNGFIPGSLLSWVTQNIAGYGLPGLTGIFNNRFLRDLPIDLPDRDESDTTGPMRDQTDSSDHAATCSGGEDLTVYRFSPVNGNSLVFGFELENDKIDLTEYAFLGYDIDSVADLSMEQQGSDLVIDLSEYGGGTITLKGFSGTLTDTQFLFTPADYPTLEVGQDPPQIIDLSNPVQVDTPNEDNTLRGITDLRDYFSFSPDNGDDLIIDFESADDSIDLRSFTDIESLADLDLELQGDNLVFDLSEHGGGSIELVDFDGVLTDANFLFDDSPIA